MTRQAKAAGHGLVSLRGTSADTPRLVLPVAFCTVSQLDPR